MTSSALVPPADSPAVCRITVVGTGRGVDLSVPGGVTVGALLPVLADRLGDEDEPGGAGHVLQRLGEEPLDPDATADSLGLRDGDILYLRRADEALAPMIFDDLADGVATVVNARSDRWRPALTRRLFLGLGALVLLLLAVVVLAAPAGPHTAVECGAVAVALTAACVVVSRAPSADRGAVLVTGAAGWAFAALAGLTAHDATAVLSLPDRRELLTGGACTVAVALVLLIAGRVPVRVFGALLVVALAVESGAGLAIGFDLDATTATTLVAVTLFLLSAIAPRLVLRLAGLRVPQLPRNADELQEDTDPRTQRDLDRRVADADAGLTLFTVGASAVYATALVLLTRESGWFEWVLALTLSAAVTLRSRSVTETGQRVALALAGSLGLVLCLVWLFVPGGSVAHVTLTVLLLAATALLLLGAVRLPTVRLLPIWGHTADILEMVTAIALVPLLLQHLHVYWYFRSLAG
ncbi:type VII secretion integral membrane protein EccD [Streptomyces sp. CRN 30]|uniref:type VII secretion integral membrane protein EccD n=1 Tax=Streptomyces sp. CRN 30 TaxID=3075613 RepID=UPI002A82347C|nr:type VII secretion integral membrane protein EccD [Streptomyces sp. CRN 30]